MTGFLARTAIGAITGIGLGAVLGKIVLGDPILGVALGVAAGALIGMTIAAGSR